MSLKLKQVFSKDVPRKEQDTTVKPSGGFIQIGQPKAGTTVEGYVARYANAEERQELAALVSKITARRALLPKFYYSICEKCGRRIKSPYGDRDLEPDRIYYCLGCNFQRHIDGGKMREMSAVEAKKYDADEAARSKRFSEQAAKSNLFGINQKRQEEGLSPLTMEQYRANEKREWERMREMERSSKPKYFNSDSIEAEKAEEPKEAEKKS